jgi:nicotinamidase-related amidase
MRQGASSSHKYVAVRRETGCGTFVVLAKGTPRGNSHEGDAGVVHRINQVARAMRSNNGIVIFVQHWGPEGDRYAPNSPGCEMLPSLEQSEGDLVVSKTACDSFCDSQLHSVLKQYDVSELWIAGWPTDSCVDTTVRAGASRRFSVSVISDAHTCADRAHLSAPAII